MRMYRPKKRKKADEEEEDDFKETPKKKVKRALPDDVDKCKAAIERADASINKWNIKKTEKVKRGRREKGEGRREKRSRTHTLPG